MSLRPLALAGFSTRSFTAKAIPRGGAFFKAQPEEKALFDSQQRCVDPLQVTHRDLEFPGTQV